MEPTTQPERRELPRAQRRRLFDAFGAMTEESKRGLCSVYGVTVHWDAISALIDDVEFGVLTYDDALTYLKAGKA